MAEEGGGVGGREGGGEAVEDSVVGVEDLGRGSEGRGVPVVVRGEDGRLGLSVNSEDVGLKLPWYGSNLMRNKREVEDEEEEQEEGNRRRSNGHGNR